MMARRCCVILENVGTVEQSGASKVLSTCNTYFTASACLPLGVILPVDISDKHVVLDRICACNPAFYPHVYIVCRHQVEIRGRWIIRSGRITVHDLPVNMLCLAIPRLPFQVILSMGAEGCTKHRAGLYTVDLAVEDSTPASS